MRTAILASLALVALCYGHLHAADPAAGPSHHTVYRIPIRFHIVSDMKMTQKGVTMTNWVTPELIEKTIMPEINRVWSAANIEWVLDAAIPATTRATGRDEVIDYVLKSVRDDDGHSDPKRVSKLISILELDRENPKAVNIHVIPYLGVTSQGVALGHRNRVIVGQWTDKPSNGRNPPVKCLLVERGDFKCGSLGRTIGHELGHLLGLGHPAKKTPPFHRLMGGSEPGYDLTETEKATARTAAAKLAAEFSSEH